MSEPLNTRLRATPSLKRADAVKVTVYPDDGRHWDTYLVSRSELVRFCWATLADLDPGEAQLAAAESGVDLKAAADGFQAQRRLSHLANTSQAPRDREPAIRPGSKSAAILLAFAAQPAPAETRAATADLCAELQEAGPRTVSHLIRMGFMRRINAGGRLTVGVFEVTEQGRVEAGRLASLNIKHLEAA